MTAIGSKVPVAVFVHQNGFGTTFQFDGVCTGQVRQKSQRTMQRIGTAAGREERFLHNVQQHPAFVNRTQTLSRSPIRKNANAMLDPLKRIKALIVGSEAGVRGIRILLRPSSP